MPKLSQTMAIASVDRGAGLTEASKSRSAAQPDAGKQIAELAMIVLDACNVTLDGNVIELNDGQIIGDAFAVRCFKELRKLAGQYGITQEEVAKQVSAEVAKQFDEIFDAGGSGMRGHMGSTDTSDRKGVFR